MKKLIAFALIIAALTMSLPISAAETRRIGELEDEIAALEDDILPQMNRVISTENAERSAADSSLVLLEHEDIAELEMYKLHILSGELPSGEMTAAELEELLLRTSTATVS